MRKFLGILFWVAVFLMITLLPLSVMAEWELSVDNNSLPCSHPYGEYRVVETVCRNIGDNKYHHWYVDICDVYCTECGEFLRQTEIWDEFDAEDHDFGTTGVCCKCGYINKCSHGTWNFEIIKTEYIAIASNTEAHIYREWEAEVCTRCGQKRNQTSFDEWDYHDFDESGYCICGYKQCAHTRTSRSNGVITYIMDADNAGQHQVEQHYEIYCLDCRVITESGIDTTLEDHAFDVDGKCVCGIVKKPDACAHANTESRLGDVTYRMDETDAELHWVQYTYDIYCIECNQVINDTWEGWGEAHAFDENGYCNACGFQMKTEEITEPLQVSISAWAYETTANMNIGATAKVSGGSGKFSYHWSASDDQHKHVQCVSDSLSWSITPKSKGTWHITITVHDTVTGEKKSATTRAIRVATPKRDEYLALLSQYSRYENPLNDSEIYDYVWDRLYPYFGEKRAKELIQMVKEAPANYRTLYLYTLFDYDILTTSHDGSVSVYDDGPNGIKFKKSDLDNDADLFHEVGHAVDSVVFYTLQLAPEQAYYVSLQFDQVMPKELATIIRDDVKKDLIARMMDHGVSEENATNIARAIVYQRDDILTKEEKKEKEKVPGYYNGDDKISLSILWVYSAYGNIADLYGGATGNYILGKNSIQINSAGHDNGYWEDGTKLPLEFWAHYFSARMRNDQEELSAFYGMLPQASKAMDEVVEILADQLVAGKYN